MSNSQPVLSDELVGLSLGDARLERRAESIMHQLATDPSASFPRVFSDPAELEALYRFLRNERVGFKALLAPHLDATTARCREQEIVRVAHDTTDFMFNDEVERVGLGPIKAKGYGQGFFLHAALAVACGPKRDVLGLLNALTYVRSLERDKDATPSEAERWAELVGLVRAQVGPDIALVHVMDREADIYALLAFLIANNERFVVRHSNYRVLPEGSAVRTTRELIAQAPVQIEREALLSKRSNKRSGKHRRTHPPRAARIATLAISAARVTLPRPVTAPPETPETLTMNIVRAYEPNPPEGESPVLGAPTCRSRSSTPASRRVHVKTPARTGARVCGYPSR